MVFDDGRLYEKAEVFRKLNVGRRTFEMYERLRNIPRIQFTKRCIRYLGRDLNAFLDRVSSLSRRKDA